MRIERAKASDFEELMDFLVVAFHSPFRFETQLADLFQPEQASMENILILRENNRIVASAGIFPIHLKLDGRPLVAQGVGCVGTHPGHRGKSLMSTLLDQALTVINGRHPPFSWLSGYRHRYGRWGWERAGSILQLTLSGRNTHAVKSGGHRVSEVQYQDIPWNDILTLRETERTRGDAPLAELKRKYMRPHLGFHLASAGGTTEAFAVTAGNTELVEFGGTRQGLLDLVVHLLKAAPSITCEMPYTHGAFFAALDPLLENVRVAANANYAIVDLLACLELLAMTTPHELAITGKGVNLRMTVGKLPEQKAFLGVENGHFVSGTDRKGFPTISVDPMRAAGLLFGPIRPSILLGSGEFRWLDALLPLPAFVPALYRV